MKKIALVFPGQGAQYVGMGQELAAEYAACQSVFVEADQRLGFPLSELIFKGPEDQLILTENTQPALVAMSIACWRLLEAEGIVPEMVAGHSLGEYAALVVAGAMSFGDAVWLVRQRGKYMAEAMPAGVGGMAAVLGASAEDVTALCQACQPYGLIEPANFNCPGQIVVSGEKAALAKAMALAKSFGAKRMIPLAVSGAFHCSMLTGVSAKLADAITQVTITDPSRTIISNYTAQPAANAAAVVEALIRQVSSPVLWEQTIRYMVDAGIDVIIEVGAGKVLTGLAKKIAPQLQLLNVEDRLSLENTLSCLKALV